MGPAWTLRLIGSPKLKKVAHATGEQHLDCVEHFITHHALPACSRFSLAAIYGKVSRTIRFMVHTEAAKVGQLCGLYNPATMSSCSVAPSCAVGAGSTDA